MAREYNIVERLKRRNEKPTVVLDEEHKYPINTKKTNVLCMMAYIRKTEKKGNDTVLYGKLYLYDKYGKSTTGYSDGSGSYIRSFTVEIDNDTGKAVSCTIK